MQTEHKALNIYPWRPISEYYALEKGAMVFRSQPVHVAVGGVRGCIIWYGRSRNEKQT